MSTCFFSTADNIYGKERINGGGSAVFIEPQIVPYGALPESSKKWQTAQKTADKQERSDTARGVISAGIIGIIILYAGVTQRKIIKFNRNNRVNRAAYQRTEYTSLVERHDDDDYPTGFGGLGNRKAIYGEDVNEADDIGIIKREKYNRQSPDN